MVISFSGLDGAGKTTQIKMLLEACERLGYRIGSIYDIYPDIRYHSTQDLIELREHLEKYDVIHLRYRLNSDENSDLMAVLEFSDLQDKYLAKATALQGYFDHIQLYRYVVCPLLKQGKTILSDRHYYDEIAFKSVYGCDYLAMKKMYINCCRPDVAFYITADPQDIMDRNADRPDGQTTLYRDITHIVRLTQVFERLVQETELITINGRRSRASVHNDILDVLHTCPKSKR